MNVSNNGLTDFLEKNGYSCPMCLDNFETTAPDLKKYPDQPNRQPTQLSCRQHNLCIACFEEHRNQIKTCPMCKEPLTFTASKPMPNSQVISGIDAVKNLWQQLNSNVGKDKDAEGPVAKKPALVKPVGMEIDQQIPEHYECVTFAEAQLNHKNVGEEIATLLPSIVNGMKWQDVANELQNDYYSSPKNWVLFTDSQKQESIGIACLKTINNMQWESHWAGVKENKVDLYLELYKQMLSYVEGKKNNNSMDWRNISLTSYFNYDTEEKWFAYIIQVLQQHNIRYEITYQHRKFPNNFELHQAKLTTYPCKKDGHLQTPLALDKQKGLARDTSFDDLAKTELNRCMETCGLKTLAIYWAKDAAPNNVESAARDLKDAFYRESQNFFIYMIDGQAKGFIRFVRKNGHLDVISCKLLGDSFKFADHFMKQFLDWATTKPIYAKGISAKKVKFSCALPSVLNLSIEKNFEKIEL